MSDDDSQGETLAQFIASFSYGSRTDLNFKFLRSLPEEEAAELIQMLLRDVGDVINGASVSGMVERVVEGQSKAYAGSGSRYQYDNGAFTKPKRPTGDLRVALVSSSGHFVAGDDPEPFGVDGMSQTEATERINEFLKDAPVLSTIPVDTTDNAYRVRHGGYDISGASIDHNVALPVAAARSLESSGRIGTLHTNAYSFVGACSQVRMQKETGPSWSDRFAREGIEAMVLVPL